MGAWGTEAWGNDKAADWFAIMNRNTGLAVYVEATLNLDPAHHSEAIRAAVYVLVQFGRNHIWPVRDLQRHLTLAITKLEAIRELEVYCESPGFVEAIDAELAILRSRVRPST